MIDPDATIMVSVTAAPPRSFYQRHRHLLRGRMAQFAMALLITSGLTLLLWQLLPLIYRFWNHSLSQLLSGLALDDAQRVTLSISTPAWRHLESVAISLPLAAPSLATLAAHLSGATLVYLLAAHLNAPFRAPLRLLAVFHGFTALASLALPNGAAYSIEEHTRVLNVFTQGLLLLLPVVMAFTHYIVERSNERRILATVLIASYLIAALPIKLLAHALLIQAASGLAMPTLFLVCGPAFDILAVTAIYAWAVTWRHGQG